MSIYAGSGRLAALNVSPPTPPSGYCLIYFKDDNVLYIKDDTGTETAIGSSSGITALTGDVTATGPGSAVASVVQVGGKTAAAIATAVNDVQAATNLNTPSTIVKRDSLGNFAANIITAALNGAASANVLKTGDTMSGPLNINSASGTALIVDTDVLVVDGALNRVGINKVNPTEALDVVGNGKFTGTISASNISGINTGDVTVTDTNTVDLTLSGQDIQADVKLSGTTLISDVSGLKVNLITDSNLTAGINANKISSGIVSNTEFDQLDGVTSNIQTQLDNKQPLDSTLTALAGYNTNGLLTQTAADTFTGRTLQSGSGISITNPDGVAGNPTIASTISQYTDEMAQDAVGNILTDTSSIDLVYNDVANTIEANAIPSGIDHNNLMNYVANQHVDHSTVNISAGSGLSGGGDITASRTISMPNVGTPGTYGTAASIPVLTTDTQGRVSSVTDTTIDISASQVNNFNEAAQDAVGSILNDSATIDFTYDDVGNTITAIVIDGSISDAKIASGINASKIGTGTVNNTEFGYLDGATSNIQSQINSITGSSVTSLTGDVTGTGPGATATTVVSVDGKTAAQVSTSVDDTLAATNLNTASTIVKREASGNFSAGTITANLTGNVNGVDPAAHASRHLPAGADPITTASAVTIIPDQANAVGTANSLSRADHIHNIPSGSVVQVGTSNFAGAAASFALSDHIHAHGNQTNGNLHAAATTSVNGFMSASDKTKLDKISAAPGTDAQILISDGTSLNPRTVSSDVSITNTGSATVNSVGGKTAAQVSTSVNDTLAATNLNTASTIVKRDSNGDFSMRDLSGRKVTLTGSFYPSEVLLTDGPTISVDVSLGNVFTVTLGGNRTLAAPTNPPASGTQKITLRIRQDATGGRLLTFNAVYNFGVDLAGISLSTTPNAFDYIGLIYNNVTLKWDVVAISRNY